MSVYLSNLSVFSSLTALLATVPIPLRKIFSSLRLCLTWILTIMFYHHVMSSQSWWQGQTYHHILTFPWSLSTCSTVSPSWPIVSLETKIKSFLLRLLLNVDMVWSLFHIYLWWLSTWPILLRALAWLSLCLESTVSSLSQDNGSDVMMSDVRSFKVTWRKGV